MTSIKIQFTNAGIPVIEDEHKRDLGPIGEYDRELVRACSELIRNITNDCIDSNPIPMPMERADFEELIEQGRATFNENKDEPRVEKRDISRIADFLLCNVFEEEKIVVHSAELGIHREATSIGYYYAAKGFLPELQYFCRLHPHMRGAKFILFALYFGQSHCVEWIINQGFDMPHKPVYKALLYSGSIACANLLWARMPQRQRYFCDKALACHHEDLFCWALAHKFAYTENGAQMCARHGYMAGLLALDARGAPFDYNVYITASCGLQFDCMRWLAEHSIERQWIRENALSFALETCNFQCFTTAFEYGSVDDELVNHIICKESEVYVPFMLERGVRFSQEQLDLCLRQRARLLPLIEKYQKVVFENPTYDWFDKDAVKYLLERGYRWKDADFFHNWAPELLRMALDNGSRMTSDLGILIEHYELRDITNFKMLYEAGTPHERCFSSVLSIVPWWEALEYLYSVDCPIYMETFIECAGDGSLDCMNWIYAHYKVPYSTCLDAIDTRLRENREKDKLYLGPPTNILDNCRSWYRWFMTNQSDEGDATKALCRRQKILDVNTQK